MLSKTSGSEGLLVFGEWEQKPGPHKGKRRSYAAAARSRQRLLNFHEKLESQSNVTPSILHRGLKRVNFASKFEESVQAEPCLFGGR